MKSFRVPLCRVFFISLVFSALHTLAQPCAPLQEGIISWWKAEGTAADERGLNFGALQNGTSFAPGQSGQAFSLDGLDDYVNVPSFSNFGTADFTVECWVRFNSLSGEQVLVEKYVETLGANPTGWSLTKLANNSIRWVQTGRADIDFGSIAAPLVWNHIGVTRSNGVVATYLNGALISSIAISANLDSTSSLKFGHRGNPTNTPGSQDTRGFYLNGDLDELAIYSRALSAGDILSIYNAGASGKCESPSVGSIISWWTADGTTASLVSTNAGTLQGGATYALGKVGQAFSFDGVDDYVSVSDSPVWAFGANDFTIELWANFASATGRRTLISSDTGTGAQNKWVFWLDNGSLIFHLNGTPGYHDIGSVPFSPTPGQWYHLAVSRSGGGLYTFYIDGIAVTTANNNAVIPDASAPLAIGMAESGFHFSGLLDEISIYNRAVSTSEILAIYNAGPAGKTREGNDFFNDIPSGSILWINGSAANNHRNYITDAFTSYGTIRMESSNGAYTSDMTVTNGAFTNAVGGVVNANQGSGGSRTIYGNVQNFGAINANFNLSFNKSGGNVHQAGTMTVPSGAVSYVVNNTTFNQDAGTLNLNGGMDFTGSRFVYNGGQITGSGAVYMDNSALAFEPGGINPGRFILTRTGSTLSGDTWPGQDIWIQGSSRGDHTTVVAPNGFNNGGAIRLESINGGYTCVLNMTSGVLVNTALGSITAYPGAGGERTLGANLLNYGTITANYGMKFSKANGLYQNEGTIITMPGQTLSMSGQNQIFSQDGGVIVNSGGFDIESATFNFNSGAVSNNPVYLHAATLNFGPNSTGPGAFTLTRSSSTVNGNIRPGQTIWIQGSSRGDHTGITSANGFSSAGTIRMESINGGYESSYYVSNGRLTNAVGGVINVNNGNGGGRTLGASLLNRGTLNANVSLSLSKASGVHDNEGSINIAGGHGLYISGQNQVFNQNAGSINGYFDVESMTFNYNGGTIVGTPYLHASKLNLGASAINPASFTLTRSSSTLNGDIKAGQTIWIQGSSRGDHTSITSTNGFQNAGTLRLESINGGYESSYYVSAGRITNTVSGVINVNPGNGGGRTLGASLLNRGTLNANVSMSLRKASGTYENEGTINIGGGQGLYISGQGQVFSQNAGSLNGYIDIESMTFNYNGGTIIGTPYLHASRLNLGPDATEPASFTLTRSSSTLTGDIKPGQLVWIQGSYRGDHTGITSANGFVNQGTLRLQSIDGAYESSYYVTSGRLTNGAGGVINVNGGNGGGRTLGAALRNLGTLNANVNMSLNKASGVHDNEGAINIASGRGLYLSGQSQVFNQNAGSISGYLDAESMTFNFNGGALSNSTVYLHASTLNFGPSAIRPANFSLTRSSATFNGNIPSGVLVWLQGSGRGNHTGITVNNGFINSGTLRLQSIDGAYTTHFVVNNGIVTNAPTGNITINSGNGGSRLFRAHVLNQGTVSINSSTSFDKAGGAFVNEGTVNIASGQTMTLTGSYAQLSGATRLSGGTLTAGSAIDFQDGSVVGHGTISQSVSNGATISPGSTIGTLSINGNLTQNSSSALEVELGGLTAGTQFDRLAVSGTVQLNGKIRASLVNGFVPSVGNTFAILTCASSFGTFSGFDLPALPAGLIWQIDYNGTSVALRIAAEPANSTLEISGVVTNTLGQPIAGVVVSAYVSPSSYTNPILNGSFEAPLVSNANFTVFPSASTNIPGWSVISTGSVAVVRNYLAVAADLDQFFDPTGASPWNAAISQTFPTVAGKNYKLLFARGSIANNGITGLGVTIDADSFSFTGTGGNSSDARWTGTSIPFTAVSSDTTITFRSLTGTDANNAFVDKVEVVPAEFGLVFEGVTDTNGQYRISIPDGTWTVSASGLPTLGYDDPTNQVVTMNGTNAVANFIGAPFSGEYFFVLGQSNPGDAATISGGGAQLPGSATVTFVATANTNAPWIFVNWTESGLPQSVNPSYTFTLSRNRILVANYTLPTFSLSANVNPSSAGSVSGTGTFTWGTSRTLTANPSFGYAFANWTEDGNIISTSPSLNITVQSNRTFVANFAEANLSHTVGTATAPSGLATVTGAGVYTNGQNGTFTAPDVLTNGLARYTFNRFLLNGNQVGTTTNYDKTFSTTDPTNLVLVAEYTAQNILPLVAAVSANAADPVGATTNFLITIRFDRSMKTSPAPLVVLTNSATTNQPVVGAVGDWSTTVFVNDTYRTPVITLTTNHEGTNRVWVSLAQDLQGAEVALTNVASVIVDTTPPLISAVSASPGIISATITWTTDESATSRVEFGATTDYASTNSIGGVRTQHSVNLTGLSPATTYHFRVLSSDVAGNPSFSGDATFTTLAASDLVVGDVIAPATAQASQPIPVTCVISNIGSGTAFGPWQNAMLLSTNADGSGAQSLGNIQFNPGAGGLAPGASITVTQSVILPANITGARYLGLRVDNANQVYELLDNNNTAFAVESLTIVATDLVLTRVTVPDNAVFGAPIPIEFVVANQGTATAAFSWNDRIHLSTTSNSFTTVVATSPAAKVPLAPGESYTNTANITLPLSNTSTAGEYYIVVAADHGNGIPESTENNNVLAALLNLSLPPLPDILVQDIVAPETVLPAVDFDLIWTITNAGPAAVTNSWRETVSFSTDGSLIGTVVGAFEITNGLASGEAIIRTNRIRIPQNVSGDVHWIVRADSESQVVESTETNNAAISASESFVPVKLTLTPPLSQVSESRVPPTVNVRVARSGAVNQALLVNLESSDPTALMVPLEMTIPAGVSAAEFPATLVRDLNVTGPKLVTLIVSKEGIGEGVATMTVLDADRARLTVAFTNDSVMQPGSVIGTITRDPVSTNALVVNLSSSSQDLSVPPSVTIPPNVPSVTFEAIAIETDRVAAPLSVRVTVGAASYDGASADIVVLNDNDPQLSISVDPSVVSEGDGGLAALGTVTRGKVNSRPLLVQLRVSDTGKLVVAPTVIIPGGLASASFHIGAIDNKVVDGDRNITVSAFVGDGFTGAPISPVADTTVTVTDVNGPALRMFLSASVAPKGSNPATTGIVRHNVSPPANPVVVTLISSDPTKATVPVSVTIPAGTNAASFTIATLDDGVPTGNQRVNFTASATDFSPDTVPFTISDIHLADLTVTEVTLPATGLTKEIVTVNYRIVNQGVDTARGGFATKIFLSDKPVLDAAATLLQEVPFNSDLPPGQGINQAISFFLPADAGNYWIIVATDSNNRITEIIENNNTGISGQPVEISPAYTATVQTSVTVAPSGTPVPLTGHAVKADNSPAAFEPVSIHIRVRGTERTIAAITDLDGSFTATFTPLTGEAGAYEIGATHPGVKTFAVQDTFSLLGMRFEPLFITQTFHPGRVMTNDVVLRNLSDRELTGLTVTAGAVDGLSVQTEAPSSIAADGSVNFRVISSSIEPRNAAGRFLINVTSSEGATVDLIVNYAVTLPEPRLEATPRSLNRGMVRDGQTLVELDILNNGGAASGEMNITLPNAPWIRAVTPSPMPSLAPGEKTRVTLQLTPDSSLPLGEYDGRIAIGNDASYAVVPFVFRHVSDAMGDVTVNAVDEVTYFGTNGTKVAGATVILRDVYTGETIHRDVTGTNGVLLLPNIREGKYHLEVAAPKHDSYLKTIEVKSGINNEFTAFLRTQLVRYSWKVEEVDIEERVNVKLETIFETFVPVPVITIEPGVIDLTKVEGSSVQVDLTVTNHGLIAAQNVVLQFQDGSTWSVHPLTDEIGVIPAKSSITLPVVFQRISGALAARNGTKSASSGSSLDDCRKPSMGLEWRVECGPFDVAYWSPVMVIDLGLCPPLPRTSQEGPDPLRWLEIFPQPGPGGGIGTPRGFPPDIGWGTRNFVSYEGEVDDCTCEEEGYEGKCKETGEIGFKAELGDYAQEALNLALQSLAFTRVLGIEMKFHGQGKLCTCCQPIEGGESVRGLKAEGEVGVDIEGKLFIGPSLHFKKSVAIPGLTEAEAEFFVGAGAEATLYGSGKVSGKTKCLLTDPEIDIELKGGFKSPIGVKGSVEVTGKNSAGAEIGGGGEVFGGIEVGFNFGGSVHISNEGVTGKLFGCTDAITAKAEGEVSIGGAYWKVGASEELIPQFCAEKEFGGAGGSGAAPSEASLLAGLLGRSVSANGGKELSDELLAAFGVNSATNVTYASTSKPAETNHVAAPQRKNPSAAATGEGVCAQVRLQIDQQAVVTRKAIGATLEISNETETPLENIGMAIEVYDADGNLANDKFIILEPELNQLVYSGSASSNQITLGGHPMQLGALATGSAKWLILPRDEAAPLEPTRYYVGGFLTYTANGVPATAEVVPGPVNVYPNAKLALKYFHQRDVFSDDPFTTEVEPSIPFMLGVMVHNKGAGIARNMSITSSQPKIVDNIKGLLIDFSIIASEVAGQSLSPSLSVNFGDIDPGEIIIGRWLLKSSLQGLFIDYKATLEHEDRFGEAGASVFESVEIHEMNKQINALAPFNDGQPDFLVNDVKDDNDLPDTLYLSDGSTNSVNVVQTASVSPNPGPGQLQVQLTAEMPSGWSYLRVPEPSNGQLRLHQVQRSDGLVITVGENAWVTDRTFIGMGLAPRRENRLHLLDYNSTGIYTLIYTTVPVPDTTAPFSSIAALPLNSRINIPLSWSGEDNENGTGIAAFDIYVSENAGPFQRWLTRSSARSGIYTGTIGNTYAFYSVAVDGAGNVQTAPASPNTQTTVTLTNHPPVLALVNNSTITEGETLQLQLAAEDSDNDGVTFALLTGAPSGMTLDAASGELKWATGQGHGPNTYSISVRATDDGTPQLSAIQTFDVNVLQINTAPTLATITNQTVNEGKIMKFNAIATDANVPAQSLTFSLLPGAPAGAMIHPTTGAFTWRPNRIQGGESYFITIEVTDDGSPTLSATRTFEVTVLDTVSDFTLTAGTTNLMSGENSSLLFSLDSPGALTNVNFIMATDTSRLTNFLIEALPPGSSATLFGVTSNEFELNFSGTIAQPLQGVMALGRLDFSTTAQSNSAIVPVRISELLAWKTSGEMIVNGYASDGRVIVVSKEPVLIAMIQGERTMVICAPPGSCVTLESKTNLLQTEWETVGNYLVEGETLTIPLPNDDAITFYRAKLCDP